MKKLLLQRKSSMRAQSVTHLTEKTLELTEILVELVRIKRNGN